MSAPMSSSGAGAGVPEVVALEPSEPPPSAAESATDRAIREAEAERARGAVPEPGSSDPPRLLLHMPVDVRSASLVILGVLACVYTLRWAAAVLIPLALSLMLVYALSPVVDRMERWRLPRWAGAAVLLLALTGGTAWTGYSLAGSAGQLVDALPAAAQKLRNAIRTKSVKASPLDTVQQAADHLERAANEGSPTTFRRGVQRVIIERPPFNVRDYLWSGTVGLMEGAGQATLVLFLTFFALCSGDTFRRKLVKMAGPSLHKKKVTVHVLDDITGHIQRYLLVQILSSALVGVTTGLAFWALGLENAAVWGIIAGVTNLIPYIGSVLVLGAAGLVAFLQFGTIGMALLVAGTSLLIHTLVGNLLVPWLTSRSSRMNPVAVFVGVIFWAWIWGVWGLLLGMPIMMVIKSVCDRVDDLRPVGELLGD